MASALGVSFLFLLNLYIGEGSFGNFVVNLSRSFYEDRGVITSPETSIYNTLGIIISIVSIVLSVGTIFLFKNRPLQAKLAKFSMIINLALLVVLVYGVEQAIEGAGSALISGNYNYISFILPVFATVSNYIAFKNILKDEALVRASDRLR
ncbi:MAG: DUF4293 family protein [Bacteroidetes bacterium]|nr:DUF4293 family protein [Bacteroidota bacterium]